MFTKCSTGQYLWVTSGFIYSDVINWLKHFKTNTMWAGAKTSIYLSLPWPKILNISDIFFFKLKLEISKWNVINVPSVPNVLFIVERHQSVFIIILVRHTYKAGWSRLCVYLKTGWETSVNKRKRKKKKSFFHKIKDLHFEMFILRQQSYLFYYVM